MSSLCFQQVAHSFASLLSIICGCIDVDGRFLALWGPQAPVHVYRMSTPLHMKCREYV